MLAGAPAGVRVDRDHSPGRRCPVHAREQRHRPVCRVGAVAQSGMKHRRKDVFLRAFERSAARYAPVKECPGRSRHVPVQTPGRSERRQDEERGVRTFETGPGKVSGPITGILGLHEGYVRNFRPGSPSGRTRNDLGHHCTPLRLVSRRRGERWTGQASSARPSCHGISARGGRVPGWGPRPRGASPGRRRSRSSGSCLPGMPWCR